MKRLIGLLLVVGLAFVLASCGTSNGPSGPPPAQPVVTIGSSGGDIALPDGTTVSFPASTGQMTVELQKVDVTQSGVPYLTTDNEYQLTIEQSSGTPPSDVTLTFPSSALDNAIVPIAVSESGGTLHDYAITTTSNGWQANVPFADIQAASIAHVQGGIKTQGTGSTIEWYFGLLKVMPSVLVYADGSQQDIDLRETSCNDSSTGQRVSCWVGYQPGPTGAVLTTALPSAPTALAAITSDAGFKAITSDVGNQLKDTALSVAANGGAEAAGATIIASAGQLAWQLELAQSAEGAVNRLVQYAFTVGYGTVDTRTANIMPSGSSWGINLSASFLVRDMGGSACGGTDCDFITLKVHSVKEPSFSYDEVWVWVQVGTHVYRIVDQGTLTTFESDTANDSSPFTYTMPDRLCGNPTSGTCTSLGFEILGVALVKDSWLRKSPEGILVNASGLPFGSVTNASAPVVTLTGPTTPPTTFSWQATDADGNLSATYFRVDDQAWQTTTATGSATVTVAQGLHTFQVRAEDSTGAVTIKEAPFTYGIAITSFQANPSFLTPGQSTAFSWTITGANSTLTCTLDPGDGSTPFTINDCGNTANRAYAYATAGNYTATLSVQNTSLESMAAVTVAAHPAIVYSGSKYGFNKPGSIAVDPSGDVWVLNSGSLTELPAGNYSNPIVYSGSNYAFNHSDGLTVGPGDNVWVANYGTFAANGDMLLDSSVVELPASDYTNPIVHSGFNGPFGVAVDASGNLWFANFSCGNLCGSSVSELLAPDYAAASGYYGPSYGFNGASGVVVDASGNVWVTNFYGKTVTELPAGNYTKPTVYGGSNYAFDGLGGLAVDGSGDVWVPDGDSNGGVTELPVGNYSNPIVYPNSKIGSTGIVVDAHGDIWSTFGNSVTELPAGNYTNPIVYADSSYGFNKAAGIALDASGNVWVTNYSGNSVTEFH